MNTAFKSTGFAPAERVPAEVIQRQSAGLGTSPLTVELLNSVLTFVFILNQQRQIIFASENCRGLLHGKEVKEILGLRPGEALGARFRLQF